MAESVLKVSNLVKSYKKKRAVDGISFELKKGECFALLGPNGAGKTTTCEIIEGLMPSDSGEVEVLGLNFKSNRKKIQERIGVQLQETNLYKKYTVKETLELFASFFRNAVPVDHIIQKMGLREKQDERLEHLSGGQRQRVYLGCALINEPELLFLDEPTTGLDPNSRKSIWEVVQGFKNEGKSILLTTHYLEEAQNLADNVAIVDDGKIIATGTPDELIERYCNEDILSFTLEEKGDAPLGDRNLTALKEKLKWLPEPQNDGTFEVLIENSTEAMKEIVRICDELKIEIKSLSVRRSTLEDAFIRLTGRSLSDGE